ncbi:MAG: ATP-binding protein [Thermoplasmata archaeon]
MTHTEDAESGFVQFPPKIGSYESHMLGPLTTKQFVALCGSFGIAALVAFFVRKFTYTLHTGLYLLDVSISLLPYILFILISVIGLVLLFGKKHGMPLTKYIVLRQRFNSLQHHLIGENAKRFVKVEDITEDMIVCPSDRFVKILEVNGTNFANLSPQEQQNLILAFKEILDSVDFDIQIITRPEQFDPQPFLKPLNPDDKLLGETVKHYGAFFVSTTSETLDRKFYVCVSTHLPQALPELYKNQQPSREVKYREASQLLDNHLQILQSAFISAGLDAKKLEGRPLIKMLQQYHRHASTGEIKSTVDVFAPERVSIYEDHIVIGEKHREYIRTLRVDGFPNALPVGFLSSLLTANAKIDVCIHIHPIRQDLALSILNSEITRLQVEYIGKAQKGSVDTSVIETQLTSFQTLQDAAIKGEEHLFYVGLYIAIRANSLQELDALTAQVNSALKASMLKINKLELQQHTAYRTIMPLGFDHLHSDYILHTSAIAAMFPFITSMLYMESGVLYGFNELNGAPVIFDRFNLENYNTCVFGVSGSGKSYYTKLEILRNLLLHKNMSCYIIDPLGEFEAVTRTLHGTVIKLGKDTGNYINPLWIGTTPKKRHEHALQFLSVLFELSWDEKALLDTTLFRLYSTHIEEITLATLLQELKTQQSLHAQRLVALLEPFVQGSYMFLNNRTNVKIDNKVVTFDISQLDKELFLPLMFLVLSYIYEKCVANLERKLVVVDEAWYLMQNETTASILANYTRHSRHYNTGITLVSQTAEDFISHKEGRVVLVNSSMITLFKHKSVSEEMKEHFSLSNAEINQIRHAATGKDVGYATALLITGTLHTPIRVVASEFEHKLITTNPEELKELEKEAKREISQTPLQTHIEVSAKQEPKKKVEFNVP